MGVETDDIRAQCTAIDAAEAEQDQRLADLRLQLTASQAEAAALQAELDALKNPPPPQPAAADFFFAPGARGTGSGLSESDAAALASLGTIASANPGRRFGILPGTYKQTGPIDFTTGGIPERPTVIVALGAHDIVGSRNAGGTAYVLPEEGTLSIRSVTGPDWGSAGNELFRFLNGANFITVDGLRTVSHRYPYKLVGNVEGLVFQNLYSMNAEDHLYQKYGTGNGARNMTVRRCQFLGYSKSAVRWNGVSDGLLIEDTVGDSGYQISGDFAMGFFCSDTARNATFRRVIARRHLDVEHWNDGSYWNGDGFVGERGNTGLRYEDCISELNSDGGFDCKAKDTYYLRCTARNVKKSFRCWDSATLDACQSVTPHKFTFGNWKGGNGAACDLEVKGGPDAAHPTVVTLTGGTTMSSVQRPAYVDGGTWYGSILQG